MGVRVGHSDLKAVSQALLDMDLEGVVRRDARCLIGFRFRGVSQIRNAKVDVAPLVSSQIRIAVWQVGWCAVVEAEGISRFLHSIAIGIDLTVDGFRGGGDTGLIEGNGYDLMAAEVANVSYLDGEVMARLPLDIKGVVDGVRQLVVLSVIGEGKHLRTVLDLRRCGEVVRNIGGFAGGLVGSRGAEWS